MAITRKKSKELCLSFGAFKRMSPYTVIKETKKNGIRNTPK